MSTLLLSCPACDSEDVTVTAEQMFMANTGDHYCHSVKIQDDRAQAGCLVCDWSGFRSDLVKPSSETGADQ